MSKKIFLKGTLILACTGLISRIAGFFYRIFLSHAIGAEGLGLYQLVLPLQGLMAALSYTGIQSALSRLIASRLALQEKKEARFSLVTGTLMAVFFSAAAGFLLFQHAYFFASAILKTPQTAGLLRITAVSIPLCASGHAGCTDRGYQGSLLSSSGACPVQGISGGKPFLEKEGSGKHRRRGQKGQ